MTGSSLEIFLRDNATARQRDKTPERLMNKGFLLSRKNLTSKKLSRQFTKYVTLEF